VPVHEIRQGVMAVCLHVHVQPDGRPGKTQQVGRIIKIRKKFWNRHIPAYIIKKQKRKNLPHPLHWM
jgi:hypothetical protein